MKTAASSKTSVVLDARIHELNALGDWRGKTMARVRALIHQADPAIVEEQKNITTNAANEASSSATQPPALQHQSSGSSNNAARRNVRLTHQRSGSG